MRIAILCSLFFAASLAHSDAPDENCQLVAGVGCGHFLINKTSKKELFSDTTTEAKYASEGITFSFNSDDVLNTIVVTSSKYRTTKNISAGASEHQVIKAYGKPEVGTGVLRKGTVPIGTVGDKVLAYPGIQFVMSRGKVWAVVIVAGGPEK